MNRSGDGSPPAHPPLLLNEAPVVKKGCPNTTATFRSYACEGVVLTSDVRASTALGPRLHRRSYEANVAVVLIP